MSDPEANAKAKADFLLASIADMQATIRAHDFKANVLLVVLALPVAKLELITPALVQLWRDPGARVAPYLLVICGVAWVFAISWTLRCLINVSNPSRHIAPHAKPSDGAYSPTGAFFAARRFRFAWWQALAVDTGVTTHATPATVVDTLPDQAGLATELAFETLKLGFILARKGACVRFAMLAGITWGAAGIGMWLCWIAHRWG